jgi:hypothetical protein
LPLIVARDVTLRVASPSIARSVWRVRNRAGTEDPDLRWQDGRSTQDRDDRVVFVEEVPVFELVCIANPMCTASGSSASISAALTQNACGSLSPTRTPPRTLGTDMPVVTIRATDWTKPDRSSASQRPQESGDARRHHDPERVDPGQQHAETTDRDRHRQWAVQGVLTEGPCSREQ